ncbi:hypothetical protein [Gynuella sp.]|uniref:hypothetical protein n=1 Tax=Gynuella sp. TaxID=2969146 RepID=UPI003D0A456A
MMIKDLKVSKELDREALVEVRGGSAYAGGQFAPQFVSGGGILSPTVANSSPINAPVALDNDTYSSLDLELNTANVFGSAFTGIFQ